MFSFLAILLFASLFAILGDYHQKIANAKRTSSGKKARSPRLITSPFDLIAAASLVAFSAMRFEVGTDYRTYLVIYTNLDTANFIDSISTSPQDFGYTAFLLATKSITPFSYAGFWASAAFTVFPIYGALKRNSQIPSLSIVLFICLAYSTAFNGVRQSMAAALLFWAWTCFRKRLLVFILISVLAGSIHATALAAAVILLCTSRLKLTKRTTIAIGAVAALGAITVDNLNILKPILDQINPRYGEYLSSGGTGIGSYMLISAYAAILLYSMLFSARIWPLRNKDHQYAVPLAIGIGIMIIGTQAVVLFRVSEYFTLFALLLLPNRISTSRGQFSTYAVTISGAVGFYIMHLLFYGDVLPYDTYWMQWDLPADYLTSW